MNKMQFLVLGLTAAAALIDLLFLLIEMKKAKAASKN